MAKERQQERHLPTRREGGLPRLRCAGGSQAQAQRSPVAATHASARRERGCQAFSASCSHHTQSNFEISSACPFAYSLPILSGRSATLKYFNI